MIQLKNNSTSYTCKFNVTKNVIFRNTGCVVPTEIGDLDSQPLNSRTYNLIIETNGDTCQTHRYIREIERKYIQARKEIKKNTASGQVKRLKKRKPLLELHRKNNPDLLCDEKKPKPDESIYDIPSSDSEPQKVVFRFPLVFYYSLCYYMTSRNQMKLCKIKNNNLKSWSRKCKDLHQAFKIDYTDDRCYINNT